MSHNENASDPNAASNTNTVGPLAATSHPDTAHEKQQGSDARERRYPTHFIYHHRVAYHETDAMGVVHHSNHVKFFEEARVEWLRDRGLMSIHAPHGPFIFAVTRLEARYFKTASFDDILEIWVQARLVGARMHFRYAIWSPRLASFIAEGSTELVPVTVELQATRLPREVCEQFRSEPWDETWTPPKT